MFNVRNGDLLIWSPDMKNLSWFNIAKYVRIFTVSEFSHVSIALKNEAGLFTVEAEIPKVKIRHIKDFSDCYCIPMDIKWNSHINNHLMENIDERYSITQAIMSPWVRPKADNKWQCVEFVINFYKNNGIEIDCVYTPSGVIKAVLDMKGKYLFSLKNKGVCL